MTDNSTLGQPLPKASLAAPGTDARAEHGLVLSLTSYPPRMKTLSLCLASLLRQTLKPQRTILWLAREEFPGKEGDIPHDVLALKEFGLEIRWTANTRSYKKLVPALQEFPGQPIVTADDDFIYAPDWLEKLYASYESHQFARLIYTHRAHKVTFRNRRLLPYMDWTHQLPPGKPSFLHFGTTGGGMLFPPGSLHADAVKEDIFMKLSPTADDVYFWGMATLGGSKTLVITGQHQLGKCLYQTGRDETLYAINGFQGQNDVQIMNMLRHYPNLTSRIVEAAMEDDFNSQEYWEQRYAKGGNSGAGSYNRLRAFKAEVINDFTRKNNIASVVDFGVGDGSQLSSCRFPSYIGVDVSQTAIRNLRAAFGHDSSKKFYTLDEYAAQQGELALSLDVIYHLVEDEVFDEYMKRLFNAGKRYVIIYSSNFDGRNGHDVHVRHRKFSQWISRNRKDWACIDFIKNRYPYSEKSTNPSNTSFADFYIYERKA